MSFSCPPPCTLDWLSWAPCLRGPSPIILYPSPMSPSLSQLVTSLFPLYTIFTHFTYLCTCSFCIFSSSQYKPCEDTDWPAFWDLKRHLSTMTAMVTACYYVAFLALAHVLYSLFKCSCIPSSQSHSKRPTSEVGTVIVPILWMRTLNYRG